MTLNKQIPPSPARRGAEPASPGRARLSRAERGSVQVAAVAVAGFCIYGFATGSPSTVGYVSSVIVIGAAIVWLRRAAFPGLLAAGLAIAAVATLAGGLINAGQNVLYNASIGPYSQALGTHLLQYDHLAHAYVSFVAAFACWVMLAAPHAGADHQPGAVHTAVSQAHVAAAVLAGTLAIAAMTLVSRCGLTRATRRAAAAMALLTGLAAVIFKYTWGTQMYGISERVLLGLGMCWISALAARAFIASTPDATAG